jgi:hypothetical protein
MSGTRIDYGPLSGRRFWYVDGKLAECEHTRESVERLDLESFAWRKPVGPQSILLTPRERRSLARHGRGRRKSVSVGRFRMFQSYKTVRYNRHLLRGQSHSGEVEFWLYLPSGESVGEKHLDDFGTMARGDRRAHAW